MAANLKPKIYRSAQGISVVVRVLLSCFIASSLVRLARLALNGLACTTSASHRAEHQRVWIPAI